MLKILLPVDGSENSSKTVADFIQLLDWYKEKPEFHLLNVQYPLDGNVSSFINQADIKQFMNNGTKYLWGLFEEAGNPIYMTPGDYYGKFIYNIDFSTAKTGRWLARGFRHHSPARHLLQRFGCD